MKLITKAAIFTAALMLTLVGFSLIVGPSVGLLQVGKQAGTTVISDYLHPVEAAPVSITVRG